MALDLFDGAKRRWAGSKLLLKPLKCWCRSLNFEEHSPRFVANKTTQAVAIRQLMHKRAEPHTLDHTKNAKTNPEMGGRFFRPVMGWPLGVLGGTVQRQITPIPSSTWEG